MSEAVWRVLDGEGNEMGPYSASDLMGFYNTGNINHETMVWTEGLEQWVPAGQVEGLLPNIPQTVTLAPAQPAPAAPPVANTAANLGAPLAPAPKPSISGWITAITTLIGVASLVLFFFPWVSVSADVSLDPKKKEIAKTVTQTGIQSITRNSTQTEKAKEFGRKALGLSEEEFDKKMAESEEDKKNDGDYEKATLILVAVIVVGLATILALIGLANKSRSLTIVAQMLFIVGGILIGTQMAQQFPLVIRFTEAYQENQKLLQEMTKEHQELAESLPPLDQMDEATKESFETHKAMVEVAQAAVKRSFRTDFEPSCFTTIGLLACCILLLVITFSTGDSSPVIQPTASGQLPPAGGIRFE